MSEIVNVQTTANVSAFGAAWLNFGTTFANYLKGTASQADVINAAGSLVSAATALSKLPGMSAIANISGFTSGISSFESDSYAYKQAVLNENSAEQTQAMLGMVSDVAGITGATAAGVAVVAPPTAPAMAIVGTGATVIGAIATTVQQGDAAMNALTEYLQELDNALMKGAIQDIQDFQINLNGPSGTHGYITYYNAADTDFYEENYNADGSYDTIANDGQGDITSTDFDANGNEIGDAWTAADGAYGWDNYNADGSYVSMTYNADGSADKTVGNADGSSTEYYTDSAGDAYQYNYDASGNETGDAWLMANGSHGWDNYNTNGSGSGMAYNPDGSSSAYAYDSAGNRTTGNYSAQGELTSLVWSNGNADVTTSTWTNPDGTHGSVSTNSYDGSASETTYGANGNYSVIFTDGRGNTTMQSYSVAGAMTSDAWTSVANGSSGSGTDTYNADGSEDSLTTTTYADGSIYSTDTVTQSDGSYQQSWTDSNGTYGSYDQLDNSNVALNFAGGTNDVILGNGLDTIQTTGGQNQINLGQGQTTLSNDNGTDWIILGNVSPDQLWFSQSGQNLVVAVLGSTESLTVTDWFNGAANQVDSFSANGLALSNSGVEQLVQAMAAYPAPSAGQTSYTTQEQQTLIPLVTSSWK